jgi:hypothetical protein
MAITPRTTTIDQFRDNVFTSMTWTPISPSPSDIDATMPLRSTRLASVLGYGTLRSTTQVSRCNANAALSPDMAFLVHVGRCISELAESYGERGSP